MNARETGLVGLILVRSNGQDLGCAKVGSIPNSLHGIDTFYDAAAGHDSA
jgi:hypothetical protein